MSWQRQQLHVSPSGPGHTSFSSLHRDGTQDDAAYTLLALLEKGMAVVAIIVFFPFCLPQDSRCHIAAADGVIHTAFLHDGSVPYPEAIKLDCAAIKAMTDAMVGTDKPFVMSSATGVIGELWEACQMSSHTSNSCSMRLPTESTLLLGVTLPVTCTTMLQGTPALYL